MELIYLKNRINIHQTKYNKRWCKKLSLINPILANYKITLYMNEVKDCDMFIKNIFKYKKSKTYEDIQDIKNDEIINHINKLYFKIFINIKYILKINNPQSLKSILIQHYTNQIITHRNMIQHCLNQNILNVYIYDKQKLKDVPFNLQSDVFKNMEMNITFLNAYFYKGFGGYTFIKTLEKNKEIIYSNILFDIIKDIYIDMDELFH